MVQKLGNNKILWFLSAFLSLTAALAGVMYPDIYSSVASTDVISGVISQDIVTIILSVIILFFVAGIKEDDSKKQIIIIGILGYLFYAYGIYVIERFYNGLYFLYMAIFALAFYSIVYSVANIGKDILQKVKLPSAVRNVSVGFSLLIPVLFTILWTSQILSFIQAGTKPEFMYSIFILDMCFIFPAFIIIIIKAIRKEGLGLLLLPVTFINGFTLLFSVALGALLKPLFNQTMNAGELLLYLGVSTVFLILAAVYFKSLRIDREAV